jgi:microcystin-dependent protein
MHTTSTRLLLGLAIVFYSVHAHSQVGIGTASPDPLSILHIQSTGKGLLVPRLSGTQMTTLAGSLTASQKGMVVRDSLTGNLMGWNGKIWTDPANLTATTPLTVSSTNQVSLNAGTQSGDLITWDGNNWVNMQPAVQHFSFTIDNRQPYLVLNYCIALQGIFPARNDGQTPFVSEIDLFPFNFAPRGFAQCNGQLMPISQNTALFSLIGTQFGGNGTSNFALPNLQSRVPVGQGQGPGLSSYFIGETGGVESNTISH